ncbi:MAG: DEAD/DEAH box helicase family protein [Kiloniellales bacterium]|nr:DEAD/DEAH box helicase family protein [Kiloniellales bacterium]
MVQIDNPILNSPFAEPSRHWQLDADGNPTGNPAEGRRASAYVVPIPKPRKKKADQAELELEGAAGAEVTPNDFINEVRGYVERWRALPPGQWGVSHETARLLQHWRSGAPTPPLFFCQLEAVETLIWLAEVAPKMGRNDLRDRLRQFNAEANPGLYRVACKMATGSGKTTVMAMLIAWQCLNATRHRGGNFSDAFLIVCPGITIRDRLRVLLPSDPENYYETRGIVPDDMLEDVRRARIVITNYHAFKLRETLKVPKYSRQVLEGRSGKLRTTETEGQMLQRVCSELLGRKNVVVINDEAHHCYRHKTEDDEAKLEAEEREEAKRNEEAARLWISGIEALARKVRVRTVYDLSATPFFLRGSGYPEGLLFPWVVSDFSLMDAIECGIVKIPRVPVSDDTLAAEMPVWRHLWPHIKDKGLPIKGRGKQKKQAQGLDPEKLPVKLTGALQALYSHYKKVYDNWVEAFGEVGLAMPPVFIVVCQNTSISKLVYDYIAGYERTEATPQGEEIAVSVPGKLELFSNYQDGKRLARPRTLLIDSEQLDSGEALSPDFKKLAGPEIETFKGELAMRFGQGHVEKIRDEDLLREVMNTVGKPGKLGESIRCVVSVSMLTEGWDANTVTHILGIRAFGTQLLCEQVVGRGLRRVSYDPDDDGMFEPEYADILGIPFTFMAEGKGGGFKPPKPTTRVHAVEERAERDPILEIRYPRVQGYRVTLPSDRLIHRFTDDSRFVLDPSITPSRARNEAIVGEGVTLSVEELRSERMPTVAFHVAGHALRSKFRDDDGNLKPYLFPQLLKITRAWLDECLECKGDTFAQMFLWRDLADEAAVRIYNACVPEESQAEEKLRPIVDPYNPEGSSARVDFQTTKQSLWETGRERSHVNYVVGDSDWELKFCEVLEQMPEVVAYVKNHNLGFEVPYADKDGERRYRPDFIVRIDDGRGREDPLNLIVEIKGYRNLDAALKADTMARFWVPAVNNHGQWGRWAFVELTDAYDQEKAIRAFLDERRKPEAAE